MNYQRARRNLLQAEAALQSLEEEYSLQESEMWITEQCTATAKVWPLLYFAWLDLCLTYYMYLTIEEMDFLTYMYEGHRI